LTTAAGSFDDGSGDEEDYSPFSYCIWLIAPATKTGSITVTFTSFSTEQRYDYVRLYTCEDAASCDSRTRTFLGELTGEYDSEQSFTAGSDVVLVVFTSDGSVQSDGFTASWTSSALVSACIQYTL
jgi:hypothetical protein